VAKSNGARSGWLVVSAPPPPALVEFFDGPNRSEPILDDQRSVVTAHAA
jgi:hypothetical protein